jgi:hypothetical protein
MYPGSIRVFGRLLPRMRNRWGRNDTSREATGIRRLDRCGSGRPQSCSPGARVRTRRIPGAQQPCPFVQSRQVGDRFVNISISTEGTRHKDDIETGKLDTVPQGTVCLSKQPLASIPTHGTAHLAACDDCPTSIPSAIRPEDHDHESTAQRGTLIVRIVEISSEAKAAIRGGGTTQPGAFSLLRACG